METVAADSVCCLSQSETWRYELTEKYLIAGVRTYCDKTNQVVLSCFSVF